MYTKPFILEQNLWTWSCVENLSTYEVSDKCEVRFMVRPEYRNNRVWNGENIEKLDSTLLQGVYKSKVSLLG